ncbi:MAG: ATP-binding protein [Acidobacteria bacterium]|nr:MAG: ATP-binding protein [Acidobacteriota bacterium]
MTTPEPTIHVRIGSRFEDIELVDLVAAAALTHLGFEEEVADKVCLAIREAVANAVQHGNRLEPDKITQVVLAIGKEDLEIEIKDEGGGFDPESVPNPLAAENLLKPTGRGIFLMRRFVDAIDFEFDDSGATVVKLRKRIPEPPKPSNSESEVEI